MYRPSESHDALIRRQMEMEDHALSMGGQRFRRKLEQAIEGGRGSQVGAAKRLLQHGLEPVEEAMRYIAEKAPNRTMAKRWISLVGPDVAAYLTLKVVLDNIHGRITVRRTAMAVTELILDELRFRRFQAEAPELYQYAMTRFTTSSYAHRARSLDARIHYAKVDVSDLSMTPNERLAVGVKLLDTVIQTTGLVRVEGRKEISNGKIREITELVATEETLQWLEEGNKVLENLWPVALPMVMPPLPWGPGRRGGYRFALRGKYSLVRSSCKQQREALESAHMPLVYEAVNRIQETAWRVNRRVLEVVRHLFFQVGGGIAGLPEASDLPLPPKPDDIDHNEEARRKWRREAHRIHELNHANKQARKALFDLLNVAKKVEHEEAIWFPHNLDFRGRIYPITSYLHPQGDDLTKGLLEFADGRPVGEEGARYLALHGGACMGATPDGRKLSHMTLEDRLAYIQSIEKDILQIAEDPYSNTLWQAAEDRWQFLAFCFDYAGYLREGPEYVSHLPVSMDGTCNGLQHFAALWRDPEGARAVNVSPDDRPHDIYQAVADRVLEALGKDFGSPYAAMWIRSGLVDRSLCKRPVMTFGYGSEVYGFGEQLYEKASETIREKRPELLDVFVQEVQGENGEVEERPCLKPACVYLAKLIWKALGDVSRSAFEGMGWFKEAAKRIAKDAKKPVSWVVPGTNFPVVQGYFAETLVRTETILAGSVWKPAVWRQTDTPDWRKQSQGAPPNIIHSLDASALMLTVSMASTAGVDSFAMVHDSYGTLAGDAPILARCTRQAFYLLYTQHDVVGSLWEQFRAQVEGCTDKNEEPVEIPEPPAKGSLDLGGVLLSPYFFS